MKRAIVTLLLVLAMVGYIGLTGSLAATSKTMKPAYCAPAYTDYIDASSNCPMVDTRGAKAPDIMGSWH